MDDSHAQSKNSSFNQILNVYIVSGGMSFSEEVFVFDFLDMVGNIGGFLGLFLGVSILSIYDLASTTVSSNYRKASWFFKLWRAFS